MQALLQEMDRQPILLLSRDPAVIALYRKLAERMEAPLVVAVEGAAVPETAPLLADANTWAADPAQRDRLVRLLCRHAANVPVACFGQMLTHEQRTALDKAGVVTARGPGRTLLRTLVFWGDLEQQGTELEPEPE
jgi:hypothetical protein